MNLEALGYWLIPLYIVLAGSIIFLSIKLGNYVDMLDKKTKISGAFIGGILLAAITSLPELFTSISSIFIVEDGAGMVIGNILGSNLFNFTILGLTIILFTKKYKNGQLEKVHIFSLLIVLAMAGLCLYAVIAPTWMQPKLGPINFIALIILGLYILNVIIQPKESSVEEESDIKLTVGQIVLRFIICAVLLVGISIIITLATDALGKLLNLGSTVAGSLFLAIATSLPEVVSTITLCKKGNFNAGFGNIVGSNVFNFCILVIAEFISWKESIFTYQDQAAFLLALFLITSTTFAVINMLVFFIFKKKKETKLNNIVFYISSISLALISFACYIGFLTLNNAITIF